MPKDSDRTRERIFLAARDEFSAHGIEGARVDRIASGAGANKQLIYRYFGDKAGLFDTVLERVLGELAEAVTLDPNDPVGYVDQLLAYHRAHPHVLRLLMWESLQRDAHSDPHDQQRHGHYRDKAAAIATGQTAGTIATTLRPEQLTLVLLGLVGWPLVTPHVTRMLLGPDQNGQQIATTVHAAAKALTSRHQ